MDGWFIDSGGFREHYTAGHVDQIIVENALIQLKRHPEAGWSVSIGKTDTQGNTHLIELTDTIPELDL